MTTLLSLVGEQPIPILLVDRALQPARHILAHTERTHRVARNLKPLLPHADLLPLENAYDLAAIRRCFEQKYHPGMVFNLTSGTKPMAWAGFEVAQRHHAQIVYLESQGKQSRLHTLGFVGNDVRQDARGLNTLLDIKTYIRAHGLQIESHLTFSNGQEVALYHFLQDAVDECLPNLKFPAFEIDFLVRRGNQVAVIEAKDKKKSSRFGIDQLTTITGREYLGIYTGRIWIVKNMPGKDLLDLARAYRIEVVQVSIQDHNTGRWRLTPESQRRLSQVLDQVLGAPDG